jgi:hypothetical protein
MTLYSFILFIHLTAVLALFAAMALEALSLFHLRRAATLNEVRLWVDPVPGLPLAAAGSLLLVFFSGIYLTIRMSAFGMAWPRVTIAAMLLLAPLAGIAAGRMRAIRRSGATASTINPDLLDRVQDPFLKVSLGIRIAVILGIVLLMGAKPELWVSVGIVGASIVLGLLSTALISYRTASLPASGSGSGEHREAERSSI